MAARNPPPRTPSTNRQSAPPPSRTAPPPAQRGGQRQPPAQGRGNGNDQPRQQAQAGAVSGRAAAPGTPQHSRPKAPAVIQGRASSQLPDYMRQDIGRGLENIRTSDYEMPRVKLLQGLSPELEQFNDVKSGEFFHTLAEQSLGTSLEMVPLHVSYRYVLWRPRWDGGGILARADDGIHWRPMHGEFNVHTDKSKKASTTWTLAPTVEESGLAEWGSFDPDDPNSQPAATLCYQIVAALPEHPDLSPVGLLLQRTAIGPARRFIGKLKIANAPIYGLRYQMESFDDSRGENDFKNWQFTGIGYVPETEYDQYRMLHESFSQQGVDIRDLDSAQDDDIPTAREDVSAEEAIDAANRKGY